MAGYQLDTYPQAWATDALAELCEILDPAVPIERIGAGRMEDFLLLRDQLKAVQNEVHDILMEAPDCGLPPDGELETLAEDPLAPAFLAAQVPEDGDADEWLEDFGGVLADLADDLHILALISLREGLVAAGFTLAEDFAMVLYEHDEESAVGEDDFGVELGVWAEHGPALAELFFASEAHRAWFLGNVEG